MTRNSANWRLTVVKHSSDRNIIIRINSTLATTYRKAYRRAFGSHDKAEQTIEEFMSGFVEDRLTEEIEFLERETEGARR